jgi:biopolymer transport protein TolR
MAVGTGGLHRTNASINVTPLIDVLLVLLIIFMLVAPVLTKALRSEIPRKADSPLPEEYAERQLVLNVAADGTLALNREPTTLENLPGRLRDVFASRGGKRVLFVDADDALPYASVVQVLDLCRSGGAESIGLVTEPLRDGR